MNKRNKNHHKVTWINDLFISYLSIVCLARELFIVEQTESNQKRVSVTTVWRVYSIPKDKFAIED